MTGKTPLPDYEEMLSPALRRELKRFGLKAIPRRKAVPLLSHIHKETRQRMMVKSSEEDVEIDLNSSQTSTASAASVEDEDSGGEEVLKESIFGLADDDGRHQQSQDGPPSSSTQQEKARPVSGSELASLVKQHIREDPELHRQVLLYEPIWLEAFFKTFKSRQNVKCKLAEVTDVLDAECVTFRTAARAARRATQRASPRKKKKKGSPAKKKSSSS